MSIGSIQEHIDEMNRRYGKEVKDMPKGLENKLLLKRKLMKTKNELLYKLVGRNSPDLTLVEKKIYQEWLQNIDDIITICEDRKRF